MIKVGIIVGSTRPGRTSDTVARWVQGLAERRTDARFEIIDIAAFDLPLLDEPVPPIVGQYTKDHTKAWSATIDALDAYVFVTPEYNHAPSAALKNALDFLYREWNDKVAGFVSYGFDDGLRAVEQLRLIVAELQVATVRAQVALSLRDDFESPYSDLKTLTPRAHHEQALTEMLDQVVAWGTALRPLRAARAAVPA